ncbi:transglycosylase SLT domain-containing protein [Shimia biformata]|uniref:transglycosylase SLT domain-containing protein n=1 Tax=Shimia biformata TaxID=1294299 RepID=UPI00194EB424|nr:transglycosylase SLT domain-containing protein [Shimia biformata]
MSRHFRALVILLLVASCGGGDMRPPRNLNDACSILQQRPKYKRAFRATERKWGVPMHVQMAVMYQESKFDGDIRTPMTYVLGVLPMGRQSSAYGYAQALDATWEDYQRDQRNRGAKRDNIRDASDFMGWYFNQSKEKNGIRLDDARNQYLAYHDGHTGYSRGTYKRKSWLMRIAAEVDARSDMYEKQLKRCR